MFHKIEVNENSHLHHYPVPLRWIFGCNETEDVAHNVDVRLCKPCNGNGK